MKKNNPLFVDSTKFHGDRILTTIELTNVCTHFGETIFVKIKDTEAKESIVPMATQSENQWVGKIYLPHQKKIEYQFFITRNEIIVATSKLKTTQAVYTISESWEPELEGVSQIGNTFKIKSIDL